MNRNADTPFELEVVADYLGRGDSVMYLTWLDAEYVEQELLTLGLDREKITERLDLKAPGAPVEDVIGGSTKASRIKVMVESISDLFFRPHRSKGTLSCDVKRRK